MGKVYNVKRQAWYLSGYLSGEGFERYHFSSGWVFPGWIGYSQWIKKEFGRYPTKEMIAELARMSKAEREKGTWFGLYLGEKSRRGVVREDEVKKKMGEGGIVKKGENVRQLALLSK